MKKKSPVVPIWIRLGMTEPTPSHANGFAGRPIMPRKKVSPVAFRGPQPPFCW